MSKKKAAPINIIELDSRDARFQTGIGRYLETLTAQMPANIHVFQIILLFSPEQKEIRIDPQEHGVFVYHPFGFPASTLYDAIIAVVAPLLSQMSNIIVKSNCLGVEGLAYMIRSRFYCKCMGVLHCLPHQSKGVKNAGGNVSFPQNPFFNMDHSVLVCDAGAEYMQIVRNTRPFSVIYNGLEPPKVQKKKPNEDGVFRFIFANGWAQHKGLHRILPAIRKVAAQRKISVMVLGGGKIEDKYKEDLEGLPIESLGLMNNAAEVEKYYNMADCALFASYSEACSYAGIEAMSHNLPIVSSDAVGLVEMFGKSGALIVGDNDEEELDTDAYANAMMRVIDSPSLRLRLGIAAYARYRSRYHIKKMADAYVALYNKLVGV